MLNITKFLTKLNYKLKIDSKKIIISKDDKEIILPIKKFEQMLFIKMIELLEELIPENEESTD